MEKMRPDVPRILAILGPTNTGKTHFALERMLGHGSGVIGFPLRLLARENYDRIVRQKGKSHVALLTGEEKIIPPQARYFVCTVESMPVGRRFDFLAIDEIQLCGDPERGHIFTDRLLHARGTWETLFLGAETMRPMIRQLIPDAEFETRPRFSTLSYSGVKKLTRLPPRSAIVGFSTSDVYHMAELIRRSRGGTAVVLGALSPRTRNAQVELYQSGDVDYMVATDAIGMGLNMDLDHVAFAGLRKFDGRHMRPLQAPEIAQIAGRAGRHMADGSFGTLSEVGPLDPEIVDAVETHDFKPLRHIFWRNSHLNFQNLTALIKSLEAHSPDPVLRRVRESDDYLALLQLSREKEIVDIAKHRSTLALLWDVCQIPDFQKVLSESHNRLLQQTFLHLTKGNGLLPEDWISHHLKRIDRPKGDIDTLTHRLAQIRTWTFITHRQNWLADSAAWREKTRQIEDRLSDALHACLTQKFVDRRAALLTRALQDRETLLGAVTHTGDVLVEGAFVGKLEGLQFSPDVETSQEEFRALMTAARRALKDEIPARIRRLEQAPNHDIVLDAEGRFYWLSEPGTAEKTTAIPQIAETQTKDKDTAPGAPRLSAHPLAYLVAGDHVLKPRLRIARNDFLEATDLRDRLQRRLERWLDQHMAQKFKCLFALTAVTTDMSVPLRGLLFQLQEGLGALPRGDLAPFLAQLTPADRKILAKLGVRIGTETLFMPLLLKPDFAVFKSLLCHLPPERRRDQNSLQAPAWLQRGQTSIALQQARQDYGLEVSEAKPALESERNHWRALGYQPLGPCLVRLDMVERLAAAARHLAKEGPFTPGNDFLSLAGCKKADIAGLLADLGYRRIQKATEDGHSEALYQRRTDNKNKNRKKHRTPQQHPPLKDHKTGKARTQQQAQAPQQEARRAESQTSKPQQPLSALKSATVMGDERSLQTAAIHPNKKTAKRSRPDKKKQASSRPPLQAASGNKPFAGLKALMNAR